MASKNTRNLSRFEPQSIPLLALPFVPFSEHKRLPRLAAIYFVLNEQGTVLYIGQSSNLAMRWARHHRAQKLSEQQATRLAWLVMKDATLLDAVETACIAYFDPPCNGHRSGTRGRPKTDAADYTSTLLRIPPPLLTAIRELAQRERRSLNSELLCAVEEYVAREGWRLLPPGHDETPVRPAASTTPRPPSPPTGIRAEVILGA